MSSKVNNQIRLIIQDKIPRSNHDGEDYTESMGKKCKTKEYVFYVDNVTEMLHVMNKTEIASIPFPDCDVSILRDNFKEAIQEKNGKLKSQLMWFWKGDSVDSVWEWFNWYFSKKKSDVR